MKGGTMARRQLLAALVLVGLFLMHGLQTFCNDSGAGGHEMGSPVGAVAVVMEAPVMGEHSNAMTTTDSGKMLDLCVAILVGGVLLATLRRSDLPRSASGEAQRSLPDWSRLRPRPPSRTLSILCVMRT